MLRVKDTAVEAAGRGGGRLFRRGEKTVELGTGDRVDRLLPEDIRKI
jgi:hypothetical protein